MSRNKSPSKIFFLRLLFFSLGLLIRLLEEPLVLGKGLDLGVHGGPLLLDQLASLADVLLGQLRGLGHLGVDQGLVVEVQARRGKEEDQDQGKQGRGREPSAQGPDGVGKSNELRERRVRCVSTCPVIRVAQPPLLCFFFLFFFCVIYDH